MGQLKIEIWKSQIMLQIQDSFDLEPQLLNLLEMWELRKSLNFLNP